jgi:hypothetical protein
MKRMYPVSVAAAAIVGAALVGTAAVAVEAPKPMSVGTKYALAGKVMQADGIGKNGETYALIYEENGTASGAGPDHKMHCLGVLQGAAGKIEEQHGYCIETDLDGDQVLWRVTPAPHPMAGAIQAVHEAVSGTGKYAGISMTLKSTDQAESTGPMRYALKVDLTP